jgi:nucleoside 2-deoxyribosyltransferase
MIKKVYMAGPVTGKDLLEAKKHRNNIADMLSDQGLMGISPLRGKKEGEEYTPQEIVNRDLMDIRNSDAILCDYFDEDHSYIGTSMEIMYAAQKEIPVFIVTGSDTIRNHYWIQNYATKIFSCIEDAVIYINNFLE